MSSYTPHVDLETEFQGDTVHVRMKRLQRKDMQRIIPYMRTDEQTGEVKVTFEDHAALAELMGELLPGYVLEFSGLKDADGNAIGLATVLEEIYFSDLLQWMVYQLFTISHLSEDEAKNSGAPSGASSKDTETSDPTS